MAQQPVKSIKADLILDAKAQLGEGAVWNYKDKKLYWIDIEGHKLHLFDPTTKDNRTIDVGTRIGTVVPAEGGAVVALQDGIYGLDLKTEQKHLLADPEDSIPNIRFNDGKCDPSGRFWVGSMGLDFKKGAASLYRIDKNHEAKRMIGNVTCSNGIVWTSDKKTMYYTDTPTGQIMAYDYNDKTGDIANGRAVITFPKGTGSPDGMTIDADNNLWVAHWGGSCIGKWNPKTGELLMKVDVGAKNVTSCAFGGDDLDILYITTADFLTEDEKQTYPNAGGLFAVKPGVKGVKAAFYKGAIKK